MIIVAIIAAILANELLLVSSRCHNWCNKHGYCSENTDAGYCICENGFTGEDCSVFMCPKSYDPLTLNDRTNRRRLRIVTAVSEGSLYGNFEFSFLRSSIKIPADANIFNSEYCTESFKNMNSAVNVQCIREKVEPNGAGTYLITLNDYPLYPTENNFHQHNGNPALSLFYCNASKVNMFEINSLPPTCDIFDADDVTNILFPSNFFFFYFLLIILFY